MEKIFGILLLLFVCNASFSQTNAKPYSFKTAYVEYELTGNTTGKQTLYIDAWGWNRSQTTNSATKMFGQKTETHEREVTKKFDSWKWSPVEKNGTKFHNKMLEDMLADPKFDMQDFSKKSLEGLGFVKTGTETINGKVCDVWKSNIGSTSWVWNNIAVKTEVRLFGTKQISTATKIELNAAIPGNEFEIPADVKFTDLGNLDPSEMIKNAEKAEQEDRSKSGDTTNSEEPPIKNLKDLKNFLKKMK